MVFHTQAESDAYHAGYKAGVASRPEARPYIDGQFQDSRKATVFMSDNTVWEYADGKWEKVLHDMNSGRT